MIKCKEKRNELLKCTDHHDEVGLPEGSDEDKNFLDCFKDIGPVVKHGAVFIGHPIAPNQTVVL